MMRFAIFGNSGSGKSTLARSLAERHNLPVLELEATGSGEQVALRA